MATELRLASSAPSQLSTPDSCFLADLLADLEYMLDETNKMIEEVSACNARLRAARELANELALGGTPASFPSHSSLGLPQSVRGSLGAVAASLRKILKMTNQLPSSAARDHLLGRVQIVCDAVRQVSEMAEELYGVLLPLVRNLDACNANE